MLDFSCILPRLCLTMLSLALAASCVSKPLETGDSPHDGGEDSGQLGDSGETGDTSDTGAWDLSIVEDLPCPDPDVVDDVYTAYPEPGSQVVITVDTVDENGFDFIMNAAYNVDPNPPWDDGGFFVYGDDDFDCSHGWEGSCPRMEFVAPEGGIILFVWSWAWLEERWDECPGVPTPYRVQATAGGEPLALELVEDDIVMVSETPTGPLVR